MVCIYCGQPTKVVNSRLQKKSNAIWRRRHCQSCSNIFTTRESADLSGALAVDSVKRNSYEVFSRDKLFISIYKSCGHRLDAVNDASAITETVIQKLLNSNDRKRALVAKTDIVNTTLTVLRRFDSVAAVTYGAYHQ